MTCADRGELEVIVAFPFPHEASLAKSVLAAYGVEAWVVDEMANWHASEPSRGVKLVVRRTDVETAREILAGDHSADLAAIAEAKLPPASDELCPHCGADALELVSRQTTAGVFRRIFGLGRRRNCRSCHRSS